MKKEYDFSKGKRGPVLGKQTGKTRLTIRIDTEIVDWFRKQAHAAGGGNYQTMINQALREHVGTGDKRLVAAVRRVVRQELATNSKRAAGL